MGRLDGKVALITGAGSGEPVLVYARGKSGQRIPMQVSVAPMRNAAGEVIGGVEVFQDAEQVFNSIRKGLMTPPLEVDAPDPVESRAA